MFAQDKNARWLYPAERELTDKEVMYVFKCRLWLVSLSLTSTIGNGSKGLMPKKKPNREPKL